MRRQFPGTERRIDIARATPLRNLELGLHPRRPERAMGPYRVAQQQVPRPCGEDRPVGTCARRRRLAISGILQIVAVRVDYRRRIAASVA